MTRSEADYELSWLKSKTNREETLKALDMARHCLEGFTRLEDIFVKRLDVINEEIDKLEVKISIEGRNAENTMKIHDLGIQLNLMRQLHLDILEAFEGEKMDEEKAAGVEEVKHE